MKRSLASTFAIAIAMLTMGQPLRAQVRAACCVVTAIDSRTSTVTAKENATGRTFEFQVTSPKLSAQIHVGMPVYANFSTMQVSLNGTADCCKIISISPPPAAVAPAPAAKPAPAPPPPPQRVSPPPASTPPGAKPVPGAPSAAAPPAPQRVLTPYVATPAAKPAPGGPSAGAPVTAPKIAPAAASSAAPLAAGEIRNKVAPAAPSCTISAIDFNTGVVTATENATSKIFQFKLNDATQLNSLQVGRGVYANFAAGQVSFDGITPNGTILSVAAAPAATSGMGVGATVVSPGTLRDEKTEKQPPAASINAAASGTPLAAPFATTTGTEASCCRITDIFAQARRASAEVNATRRTFSFLVPNADLAQTLVRGQPVWANFGAGRVSLDGRIECCSIVASGTSAPLRTDAGGTTEQPPGGQRILSHGAGVKEGKTTVAAPTSGAPLMFPCSSSIKIGLPQLRNEQEGVVVCLRMTPPPALAPNADLRVQAASAITMNTTVTGTTPGNSGLLYRFSVLFLEGSAWQEVASSGDFSLVNKWTWQVPADSPATTAKLKVAVQGTGIFRGMQGETEAGNYLIVNDALAASIFLDQMGTVMLRPRCSNCHAMGDVPTQGDDRHLHVPPVTRQTDCKKCHGDTNGATVGSPPGAPGWRMAPFAFAGRSATQLCKQLTDPAQNGGRTPQGLADHLINFNTGSAISDPLANWAYSPGPGRTPAPGLDLFDGIWSSFESWVKYGAACPADPVSNSSNGPLGPGGDKRGTRIIRQMGCSSLPAMTWYQQGWAGSALTADCEGDGGAYTSYLTRLLGVGVNLASPAPDTGLDIGLTLSPPEMATSLTPSSLHFDPRTTSATVTYRVQPVASDTVVTVTARDPLSGTQHSTSLHILAPQPAGLKFLAGDGNEITSLSSIPPTGTAVKVKTYYTTVAPDTGVSIDYSYGGTASVSGPCGVNPTIPCRTTVQTQIIYGDKPTAFASFLDLTVSPCAGNAPCQVVVSVGSQKATLTVNP